MQFFLYYNISNAYKTIGMKKISFFLFIAFVVKGSAQNADYVIDMNGIGAIKIGMSQSQI